MNKLKDKVEVIGPAESPIARIKARHRWQLLLKGKDARAVHDLAKDILSKASVTALDIKSRCGSAELYVTVAGKQFPQDACFTICSILESSLSMAPLIIRKAFG